MTSDVSTQNEESLESLENVPVRTTRQWLSKRQSATVATFRSMPASTSYGSTATSS